MKGIIVTNGFTYSLAQAYKVRRLTEEFKKLEVSIDENSTVNLVASIKDSSIEIKKLDGYDFCIFLDKDRYLSYAIESKIPLFNSAEAIKICDDKMDTYLALKGLGIKTPKTIAAPLCYDISPDPLYIEEFVDHIEKELNFPLVIKECYGSLGKQVYLINNHEELLENYHRLLRVPHIYQEYISSSFGRDVRMFTIGGKLVAAMERRNENEFRSNVASGGVGYQIEPSKEFQEVAEKISKKIGLAYAGIDLMFGKDEEPILAEVNSNAFFTEIEKVSGVNVTKLLVEYIYDKLSNIQ